MKLSLNIGAFRALVSRTITNTRVHRLSSCFGEAHFVHAAHSYRRAIGSEVEPTSRTREDARLTSGLQLEPVNWQHREHRRSIPSSVAGPTLLAFSACRAGAIGDCCDSETCVTSAICGTETRFPRFPRKLQTAVTYCSCIVQMTRCPLPT